MPLAAAVPYIATALGATAATAATAGTVANIAGGIYSGYEALNQNNKSQSAARDAGVASQVNIQALNEQAKEIAKQNALDSAELERQMTPQVPAIRQAAQQGILSGLGPTEGETQAQGLLSQNLGHGLQTPLLQAAIAKARADLGLGGQLGVDQQNLVTRQGLAHAGQVGGGDLGLGRDVVARDLGLTSLQVEQQRLQNAQQLGGLEQQGAQFDSNNLLNQIQLLKSISDGQFGRSVTGAQFGESVRQPIIGLDPSSVANISIGNQNARSASLANQADIYGQSSNNWLKLLGTVGGAAAGAYKPGTVSNSSYPS